MEVYTISRKKSLTKQNCLATEKNNKIATFYYFGKPLQIPYEFFYQNSIPNQRKGFKDQENCIIEKYKAQIFILKTLHKKVPIKLHKIVYKHVSIREILNQNKLSSFKKKYFIWIAF